MWLIKLQTLRESSHEQRIKNSNKSEVIVQLQNRKKCVDLKNQVFCKNTKDSEQTATMWIERFFFTVIKYNHSEYKVLIECQ